MTVMILIMLSILIQMMVMILMRSLMSHFSPPLRCPDLQPTVSAGSGCGCLRRAALLHQLSPLGSTAFHTGKKHLR